ncbi:MAG TPA: magnesium-translocating P-type ATPase [Asticcacaulis sp.]|nr:magnesium-translocating P-type ATPase [Asticcacaulis sp.]
MAPNVQSREPIQMPQTTNPSLLDVADYWTHPATELLSVLGSRTAGLTSGEAADRLKAWGANRVCARHGQPALVVLLRQFRSPLVLILIVATMISVAVGQGHEAAIIAAIVFLSCALSFTQEWSASRAVYALQARLAHKVNVRRDGRAVIVPADEVVPGDLILLSAGDLIPADGVIVEASDLNVSEAVLTGETFPVVKAAGVSPADADISRRSNAVFAGASVRSGTATVLIAATANQTEFARIARAVARQAPETDFSKGIRRFGNLMTQIMLAMAPIVLVANLLLHRPIIDSLLFSLALAVGITPELLPAIISVTLASGARRMAADGVIVRRLEAIENLGSMDILCTDKTGTLTQGSIRMDAAVDWSGAPSNDVLQLAMTNARLQTGMKNPLDDAILAVAPSARLRDDQIKAGEVPYDFERKRLSVAVRISSGRLLLICKGAVDNVLAQCSGAVSSGGSIPLDAASRLAMLERFRSWSKQGFRILAVACRNLDDSEAITREAETRLDLAGFLLFMDPPKTGMGETLKALAGRGIHLKMITGDNRYVARHVADAVGLTAPALLTGDEIGRMSKDALFAAVGRTDIFAEIDPDQKERIIAALRRAGHVVGYLGDGVNDAPALHEADIGISVDTAVEVAREAADMVLLRQDLSVLLTGVHDGRRTFVNTLKYISITTSANFGNMISMALASFFLPFLPLAAKQILLNNFLSDIPSMAIATDRVESNITRAPKRWDIGYIRRFMIVFGLISSAFDVLTFLFLLYGSDRAEALFQTGWFVESLVTELAIVLVVRTRRPIWKSHPSRWLLSLSAGMSLIAVALPYTLAGAWFGLVPLPLPILFGVGVITFIYLAASELAKHWFFRNEQRRHGRRLHLRPAVVGAGS